MYPWEAVFFFRLSKAVPLSFCPLWLLIPDRNNKSSGTACGLSEGIKDPWQGRTAAPWFPYVLRRSCRPGLVCVLWRGLCTPAVLLPSVAVRAPL